MLPLDNGPVPASGIKDTRALCLETMKARCYIVHSQKNQGLEAKWIRGVRPMYLQESGQSILRKRLEVELIRYRTNSLSDTYQVPGFIISSARISSLLKRSGRTSLSSRLYVVPEQGAQEQA